MNATDTLLDAAVFAQRAAAASHAGEVIRFARAYHLAASGVRVRTYGIETWTLRGYYGDKVAFVGPLPR